MLLALTTAERAELIAVISAVFVAGGLVWQMRLYRLSGARLTVRLVPGVVTDAGALMTADKGWRSDTPERMVDNVGDRPWIEVAVITVTNYGRAPISVSNVALDFGAWPWWKPWQRHTVVGTPVELHGGAGSESDHRLEAGQTLKLIYDPWLIIEESEADRSKTLRVRASALPAGRWRRPKRSSYRRRWRIEPGQEAMWADGPDHDRLEIFRAVWRAVAFRHPNDIYAAWTSVDSLLMDVEHGEPPDFFNPDADPPSVSDIAEAIQPPFDNAIEASWPAARIYGAIMRSGIFHSDT